MLPVRILVCRHDALGGRVAQVVTKVAMGQRRSTARPGLEQLRAEMEALPEVAHGIRRLDQLALLRSQR